MKRSLPRHRIQILNTTRKRLPLALLKTALNKMLENEAPSPTEMTVLLTHKEEVKRLNREFRGKDEFTDVLSFPAKPVPQSARLRKRHYLGDIAIAYEVAEEQAQSRGVPLSYELACLALHGALHLLGYHHETARSQKVMDQKMKSALRSAGCSIKSDWFSLKHV
jgi:probable rRNA maturation factor